MNIREHYKIDEQAENIISLNYGQWDSWRGITIVEPNIWKRRSDLQGYNFRYFTSILYLAAISFIKQNEIYIQFIALIKNVINFRITTIGKDHSTDLSENGCRSPQCFKGIYANVLHLIQASLNFTYTIRGDNTVGHEQLNGSWSGQFGK